MIEHDDALWLVLDWCQRCGGSGYIEACYECPDCAGTGQEWRPITADDGGNEMPDEDD